MINTIDVLLSCCAMAYRLRKQKLNQKALLRCQQKTINGGVMDGVPALLQGLNGRQVAGVNEDDEGVFYDELISYPPQFRAPSHHPPAYEVTIVVELLYVLVKGQP